MNDLIKTTIGRIFRNFYNNNNTKNSLFINIFCSKTSIFLSLSFFYLLSHVQVNGNTYFNDVKVIIIIMIESSYACCVLIILPTDFGHGGQSTRDQPTARDAQAINPLLSNE